MQQSPKMLIVCVSMSLLIIVGYIWSRMGTTNVNTNTSDSVSKEIPKDLAAGDTDNDLLKSILARQDNMDKTASILKKEIEYLEKGKNDAEHERNSILKKFKEYVDKTNQLIDDSKNNIINYKNNLAYSDVEGESKTGSELITEVVDISTKQFSNNSGFAIEKVSQSGLPTEKSSWADKSTNNKSAIPFITIPKTSTLSDVKLMTSLIAQVPVAGRLMTPAFPFKAIVGKKDLIAANGINIPSEASGIVLEGYSVGDMSLACARGYITSLLFVFKDGHFVSYPETSTSNGMEIYPKDAIGYISNAFNSTCISGQYISNAHKVLGSQAAMGAIAGAGHGIAQAQLSTMTNAFQSNQVLTQDTGKYVGGMAMGGLADRTLDWYNKRITDVFDAVYVPAVSKGKIQAVSVHITKTINIDYDKNARKIRNDSYAKDITTASLD